MNSNSFFMHIIFCSESAFIQALKQMVYHSYSNLYSSALQESVHSLAMTTIVVDSPRAWGTVLGNCIFYPDMTLACSHLSPIISLVPYSLHLVRYWFSHVSTNNRVHLDIFMKWVSEANVSYPGNGHLAFLIVHTLVINPFLKAYLCTVIFTSADDVTMIRCCCHACPLASSLCIQNKLEKFCLEFRKLSQFMFVVLEVMVLRCIFKCSIQTSDQVFGQK